MKNIMCLTWLLMLLVLGTVTAEAANHYVRAGASGNGSDWANACADFTGSCAAASLVRGDTYYVADGTYASRTFNTPASSNLGITIKKATVSNHGTETGWDSTYGNGQATFAGQIHFTTSNWVFDGTTRNESDWFDYAAYGFAVGTHAETTQISLLNCPAVFHNISIKYTYVKGYSNYAGLPGGTDIGAYAIHSNSTGCTDQQYTGLVFHRMLIRYGVNQWLIRNTTGTIIEYSAAELAIGNSGNHGDAINLYYSVQNATIRYNQFRNEYTIACGGCGSTGIMPLCCGSHGTEVYGNWFSDFRAGDGLIGYLGGTSNNNKIYNNTIDSCNSGTGGSGGLNLGGTGNTAYNNIWTNCGSIPFAGVTHNYNAFPDSNARGEGNAQLNVSTSIFLNYAGKDFRLNSPTAAGTPLSPPFNVDPMGKTRGTSGIWNRGTFELATTTGDVTPPLVPVGLTIQ
jgi:hypothetical protein